MKHITFGDKSLLVGDEVAEALLEYAAFLASNSNGDTVELRAISSDGDEVDAIFLLGPGVTMMAESAHTNLPEPDNTEAMEYMAHAQIRATVRSEVAMDSDLGSSDYDGIFGLDPQQPR